MSLLRLESVSKRFGAVTALDTVDLAVESGGRTAVVGPSGSGKSTLLRIVAGFETPDAGRVVLDGRAVAGPASSVPTHLRSIGLVSQDGSLFPHLTIAENVGFGLDRRVADRSRRILALLDMVELDRGMGSRRPHELSGGQQQRVALARALARQPKLMLLDEPFSALDAELRDGLRRTVTALLAAERIAALLVTHDRAEALGFADQLVTMVDGRILQSGMPRSIYFEPRDRLVAALLGETVVLPATLEGEWAVCVLGRVRTNAPTDRHGLARVMFRPEQMRLHSLRDGMARTDCVARVIDVEFGGPTSVVRLLFAGKGTACAMDDDSVVAVRTSTVEAPSVGEFIAVEVRGAARVVE